MKATIARAGYALNTRLGIWLHTDYKGISYSDGDEVEQRIGSVVNAAGDLSVLSEELREHCVDWPSLYHLSALRANILRPFEHCLGGDVLEIGAGCGAITRYLGECGGNILALEGSPRRATIARARTRDLPNVEVISERFDDFRCDGKFDVVTLIGVLEYANMFTSGANPVLTMLERARTLLKPGGVLIIAIENQLGLKYFAGAAEDHIGQAMYGIEGRYRSNEPQTFGRKAMTELLAQAGYQGTSFLAPFPDYKLPVSIVTESGFLAPDFDAAALASQSVPRDPQLPQLLAFSPELVWPIIAKNGLALDLANSFLIVAGNGEHSAVAPSVLAWHYSTGRRRKFCKKTSFVRTEEGQIEARYLMLASPDGSGSPDTDLLKLYVPEKSAYVHGRPMSQEIIEIFSRDGWTFEEVGQFFRNYIRVLERVLAKSEGKFKIDDPGLKLPAPCFDMVPHNIIVTADGGHCLIDKEWNLDGGIDAGFLMFRSLLNILSLTRRIGHSSEKFDLTPLGLVVATMEAIGWAVTTETVIGYAELEATIQQAVQGGPNKLDQILDFLMKGILVRRNLSQQVEENNKQLAALNQEIAQRDVEFSRATAQRDDEIARLGMSIVEFRSSTSWRITAPLRFMSRQIWRIRRAIGLLPDATAHSRGTVRAIGKALSVLRKEGIVGLRERLRALEMTRQLVPEPRPERDEEDNGNWFIVPYYVDPLLDEQLEQCPNECSVAVHLHLSHDGILDSVATRLANIPCTFDLYVSVLEERDCKHTASRLQACLPHVGLVVVEQVPNRGRNLAPLIIQFGERLLRYTVVGHFHTDKQPDDLHDKQNSELFDHLLGPLQSGGGRIAHFLKLLRTRAKFIYPERYVDPLADEPDGAEDYEIARDVLKQYTSLSIENFPPLEFLKGSMFWARCVCLREFLKLPIAFDDFPEEPAPPGGMLVHALERLILIFAHEYEGQFLRLHRGDSIQDYRGYEECQDFMDTIIHDDIKILAYYLPQFHPIPENDEWHGKGFTEWTKVRAANPIFEGHYQQHIPHPDIGYYLLDSPETLRMQTDIMRKAGVHGMVFYHYWFDGKMILEQPARTLLDTPDIAMPYCFCWANENWTRRWDGNENEILLGQNYSPDDARAFIRYMISFFQDPRYLRVDGRPVMFIYRSASIPEISTYIDIWAEECRTAGLPAPYLGAVLTRGAVHPAEFGMDAGVERVLHDWTDGNAPDIKAALTPYVPLHGKVLSYNDVADFYSAQTEAKDFIYFRSLIPIWDNTARYGSEAYIVHGSTPERFQEWLECAIRYSKNNLPSDRRLVFINAWNEWAEGAHLEPDTRYGYAYLNAVGRALSGIPYSTLLNPSAIEVDQTRIHLSFSPRFHEHLDKDAILAERFFYVLAHSSIFWRCAVTVDAGLCSQFPLTTTEGNPEDADFILEFRKPAFFEPHTIEKMVQTALAHREAVVIPNAYPGDRPLVLVAANGSVRPKDIGSAPMALFSPHAPKNGFKNCLMRTDAPCFVAEFNTNIPDNLPVVTVIVRIHKSADLGLLRNALYCLAAMRNCICVPLIAAQDFGPEQSRTLAALLDEIPWYFGHAPEIDHYYSLAKRGDMRSQMLNKSLRKVKTRYASFLDYDDLLMRNAYEWLIDRLNKTGKAVAFGRVFSTSFSYTTGVWLERRRAYEYGYSYEDFVEHNHAPIHSFLMDMSRIDLTDVIYHDDQRYMEDYLLTLQIFTKDNCDWDGLKQNRYIGDYIHSVDRSHTLAFTSDADRCMIQNDAGYKLCENRIKEMRKKILSCP